MEDARTTAGTGKTEETEKIKEDHPTQTETEEAEETRLRICKTKRI